MMGFLRSKRARRAPGVCPRWSPEQPFLQDPFLVPTQVSAPIASEKQSEPGPVASQNHGVGQPRGDTNLEVRSVGANFHFNPNGRVVPDISMDALPPYPHPHHFGIRGNAVSNEGLPQSLIHPNGDHKFLKALLPCLGADHQHLAEDAIHIWAVVVKASLLSALVALVPAFPVDVSVHSGVVPPWETSPPGLVLD